MSSKFEQMWEKLKDLDFRKQFIDAYVDERIAFQIRSLRNKKEKTQPEFAQELGVKQPLVSSWENPSYGRYSLSTLKKLAKAFDVGLLVSFVPFSTLINWTIDLTPNVIAPPSFAEEQKHALASVAAVSYPMGSNAVTGSIVVTEGIVTMDVIGYSFNPTLNPNTKRVQESEKEKVPAYA